MNTNYKKDCSIVHETVVRDIVDIITDLKDTDEVKLLTNRKGSYKSIAAATDNLVLVFPVIVSSNLSIDTAAMITKAIERKAVSMLQILFSAISVTNSDDAFEYIATFHKNLKVNSKMNVDDFVDTIDAISKMDESTIIIKDPIHYNIAVKYLRDDMRNINNILPRGLNETSINDYKVLPQSLYGKEMVVKEAISSDSNTKASKDISDYYNKQLLSSDVRKANELVPTTMIVNFVTTAPDCKTPIEQHVIIGVKAKMYPVDSADILNRIKLKNQDNNGLLKLVKATTREIGFCRDFLFAIDKAKLDALSQSRRGSSSELWKVLERRALMSKIKRSIASINDASAITTIVISQEEVDYLKKMESIDVSKPRVIQPIMESYNLIGFCIADEVQEVAHFIWDTGNDIYESLSFNNLEKENTSNDYKKIVNLMTKVSR